MEINNVLYLVGKYLGDNTLIEETSGSSSSSEGRDAVVSYIKLLNIVQKRIATEWIALKTMDVIKTKSQIIKFSDLKKKYYKLIKVVSNNKPVKFNMLDDGIALENGEYEIWYQYLPADVEISDSAMFDFNGRISERVMALGVASEYCALNGMYETSNYFEEKFLNSLNALRTNWVHKTMPKRRWL